MPLPGIRLSDLYNSDDYNNWMSDSTNVKLVESTIRQNRYSDPDKIKGHLYMNSKIKQNIGEDAFNSLPEGMTLDEKINWYNSNIPQEPEKATESSSGEPTDEYFQDTANVSGFYTPKPVVNDADIVPKSDDGHAMYNWFENKAETTTDKAYRDFISKAKEDITHTPEVESLLNEENIVSLNLSDENDEATKLFNQINKMKSEHPENTAGINLLQNKLTSILQERGQKEKEAVQQAESDIEDFKLIYNNIFDRNNQRYLPINRELWGSAKTQNTVDELTSNIRQRLEEDPQFAFNAFEQFDRLAYEMIPQYRNYHDTDAMPITPNEMKDIMAQYYSLRTLKDLNEANNITQAALQHTLAEHQSILQKADVAINQAAKYFTGNTAAVAGIVANTPNAIAWAMRDDLDIEDLGGFKEFLYYTTQNPITQWGNDLQSTGAWLPDVQERFKELEYNSSVLQREPGNETKFRDINTPFDIFAQGAYTVAGMFTGSTAAQLLNATLGRASARMATKLLAREAAGAGTRFTARAINTLGNAIAVGATAYLPAAAEASMDAMEKYNIVKESAEDDILAGIDKELQRDLEDGTFENWYNSYSRIPDWNGEELSGTDAAEYQQIKNQERAYLWDQYRNLKVQQVLSDPNVKNAIEQEAFRTGAKTMFDEATWIAFGDTFFSNILGRSFRELKKGVVRGVTGKPSTKYNWVPEGNFYKAVPKKATGWQKAGAVGKGIIEAAEEGFEELFQTVDSQMREDLAHNYMEEYVANRYDPNAIGQLSDSMFENWDVASKSIGKTALSEEALYSFLLGATSAGLGSPTIARGIKSTIDKHRKGQKASFSDFWRNPIVENLQELKIKELQDADEAADINRWLQQHPEVSTYNDEAAILKFMTDEQQAASRDDEADYRDALMGKKVATMLMLDRVRPNGMKLNFLARLETLSKLDPNSQEARAVVNQALSDSDSDIVRTTEGPLNEEETKILEKVKDKAKEDLNTYKNLKAQIKVFDNQFGNSISTEAKEALAYGIIMRQNWEKRIEDINKAARDSYNKANQENPTAILSEEDADTKNAIARYGSLKAVEDEYKELVNARTKLRASKKNMYKHEYKTEFDKNSRQIRENRAAKKLLSKENLPIISANEILSLSNKARAYILDEANKKNYSEQQQKEIEKFVTSQGITGQTLTDLKDAGRLQNRLDYFNDQYNTLIENNGALVPLFDREVRAKASEKWSRAKLQNVLEATTYEQFRDELDKDLTTGEFTENDKMQFSKIFNDPSNPNKDSSKFYQQYKKEEMSRAQTRKIMENSPAYKALSEPQKKVANQVISEQQLSREPLTADKIIEKLNDPKFAEQLTSEQLEGLAEALKEVIKQKESYDKAVAAERARQEKLAKTKIEENKKQGTPGSQQNSDTVINNSRYNSNKDFFDVIFKKIASIFSKTNPQELSKEEFINFISLYSDEELSTDILGEDFNTELTLSNFSKIISSLLSTLDNAAYLNPNASNDIKYQNTIQLVGTLKGLVQTVEMSKRTSKPTDLNRLIKNSILEVNPSMMADFKVKVQERLLSSLKEFNSKKFSILGTQAEKDWYNNNNIENNLAKIASLRASKQYYVFIKDESLINSIRQELGLEDFTDDNLPLIIAARVTKDTERAVQLEDGNYYLYAGLLQDSRESAGLYDRNELNTLRAIAAQQEEFGPVKQNGKVYTSRGGIIKYTNKSEDVAVQTDSMKEWLLDKHKGDKEAAKKDFIEHFRGLNVTIKNGEASGVIEWKGKNINVSFHTESTAPSWKYAVYLLEKPDGTVDPKFLHVRELDEFSFDDEIGVSDVFEALSGPLLTDVKYKKVKELDFLRRPINYIYQQISASIRGLEANRASTRNAALSEINKAVNNYLKRRFNFKKAAKGAPEFQTEITINNDSLQYTVYQLDDNDRKVQYRDIPRVISSMPLSEIKSKEAVLRFIQDAFKNLMFDEDGNLRRDDNQSPLVKLEVNYRENESQATRVFDPDKVEDLLLANAWKLMDKELNPVPESISVNPTVQPGAAPIKDTGNPVQDAIDAITQPEFIDEHEGEHFEVGPNETEVTTFIKGLEDGADFDSLTGQMATNLGSSIDKLYRVWRKTKNSEDVKKYMKDNNLGSWVGLSAMDIPVMCQQFERIERIFQQKQEVPINVDLIFRGQINVNGKSHYFIGKPDIITVDKQGKYHIYDMKSFRYQSGVSKSVPGILNPSFILNGIRNFENSFSYWQQQMSIYRVLIESKLGEGTVVPEFGVIPVRLGYSPQGSIGNMKEGIGAREVKDSTGKSLHLSFAKVPLEMSPTKQPEKITRCYDDAIKIPAILDITTINPTGWKQMSKADEIKSSMQQVREDKVDVKNEPTPEVEVAKVAPPSKSMDGKSADDIAKELAGPESDISIEDLINGACQDVEF